MSWTAIRAELAAVKRHHPERDTSELRRDLRAAVVENYLRQKLSERPPFSDEQLARLRALFPPALSNEDRSGRSVNRTALGRHPAA